MVAQGKASRAGRAGGAGSEMWGVLLVPSSSPTLSPIYDGLDVNVTSNVTWFHLNHNMVSRRIYKTILQRRARHYKAPKMTSPYRKTRATIEVHHFFLEIPHF